MTITRQFLQKIREAERPFIRQAMQLATHFAETRKLVADEGGDWGSLKAVLKAEILDEDGGDHLEKVLGHDGDRTAYADMLGLATGKMNNKNFSSVEPKSETAVSNTTRRPADSGEPALAATSPPDTPASAGSSFHDPDDINDIRNMSFRRGPKAVA